MLCYLFPQNSWHFAGNESAEHCSVPRTQFHWTSTSLRVNSATSPLQASSRKKNRVYKIVEMSVMHCTVVGTQLSSVVKHRCDGFSTGYVSRGLAVTPLRTPLVTDLRQGLRKQFTFVSGCNLLTDSDRNVLEFTAEKIVHAFRYLPVGCSSINTEIISRNTPRTRYYVGQPHGFPHKHTRILSHINRT